MALESLRLSATMQRGEPLGLKHRCACLAAQGLCVWAQYRRKHSILPG